MTDLLPNETPLDAPIVITKDEANSRHVDDLIKRQMSLRGEGIATEPRRRWYYQNWLLFMLVGAVAAFLAWAVIEPRFDDYHYTQGKVEAMNLDEVFTPPNQNPDEPSELYGRGHVTVRGQKIWFYPVAEQLENDRARGHFDASTLQPGQEIGLYTKYYPVGGGEDLAIAHFVDPHPKTPATGKALTPLREQNSTTDTFALLTFSIVAGFIGLGIGAADGIVCRVWRRALIGGLVGMLIGLVGALFTSVAARVVYIMLSNFAMSQRSSDSSAAQALGFLLQMIARMFAWTLAGMAMGLGQGVALRSKRLLAYGFLGGIIGGLLGGLLFDPLDLVILGQDRVGAEISRLVGFVVIGAAVGAMIGIVELLTRDAWLRMTEGPLAGKEFLIFRDTMNIGASPKSEIYLFNDPGVAATHAQLRVIGDETEITARDRVHPLIVNQSAVRNARLRHGVLRADLPRAWSGRLRGFF
ncbi:MAG TPA: FHA domain-containing protein, partial [Thermoanaerobaculia bacterium]|nr:FHA domain-containing protein [Thermoanaerobaculia bacterium]